MNTAAPYDDSCRGFLQASGGLALSLPFIPGIARRGHFALATDGDTIAKLMREFLGKHVARN